VSCATRCVQIVAGKATREIAIDNKWCAPWSYLPDD
jgi:hypothetical protein